MCVPSVICVSADCVIGIESNDILFRCFDSVGFVCEVFVLSFFFFFFWGGGVFCSNVIICFLSFFLCYFFFPPLFLCFFVVFILCFFLLLLFCLSVSQSLSHSQSVTQSLSHSQSVSQSVSQPFFLFSVCLSNQQTMGSRPNCARTIIDVTH